MLHSNFTYFVALGLPTGKTTVMHLVPRESLPEPNSQGKLLLYMIHFVRWNYINEILGKVILNHGQPVVLIPSITDDENKKKGRSRGCCSCSLL